MSKLYTREMKRAISKMPCPLEIRVDIVGYKDSLALRIYEQDIRPLNEGERVKLMSYLYDLKGLIESFDVRCTIQGLPIWQQKEWYGKRR